MLLGIEIGGTKLQLGVGTGTGPPLVALERFDVDREAGASGILDQLADHARPLIAKYDVRQVGIGFGGPVDPDRGRTVKSHHVTGWDDFPLTDWCRDTLDLPAIIANDADAAGLAEAVYGAGRDFNQVFYVTVGTGIGGGLIIDRRIYRGAGAGAAELGHLRPGLSADNPEAILESFAAGWGIAAAAQARLAEPFSHRIDPLRGGFSSRRPEDVRQRLIEVEEADEAFAGNLLERCNGRIEQLSARIVGEAAAEGNAVAQQVLDRAWQALGWGIAQMITLVAPEVVVIGGGVSLLGEALFFEPLRREVERYVFPPFLEKYRIIPAALGEDMVVHGALALAAQGINA